MKQLKWIEPNSNQESIPKPNEVNDDCFPYKKNILKGAYFAEEVRGTQFAVKFN